MTAAQTGPFPLARDVDLADACTQAPEVSGALDGMMRPIKVERLSYAFKDGRSTEKFQELDTLGTLQPFRMRELEILPEGERAWKWYALYSYRDLALKEGDRVAIKGKKYRVMKDADWSFGGFFRYNIVEGYDDAR